MSHDFDATRLSLLLNDLRLPAIKQIWSSFAERSDTEGWPAARLLMALAEHEVAERDRRRIERHLRDAKLLPGKTLENFDFNAVPMVSRAHVSALCAGDGWLRNGANLILLGPSGGGKPAGERLESPVRSYHRPRAAVAGRAPRARSGVRHQPAGSLRSRDSG
jgi:DNA replication protein DnaC